MDILLHQHMENGRDTTSLSSTSQIQPLRHCFQPVESDGGEAEQAEPPLPAPADPPSPSQAGFMAQ